MLLGNTGLSTSRLGAAISPLVCVTQRRLPSAFSPGHRHFACTSKCSAQAATAVQEAMPRSLTPSRSSSTDLSSVLALDNIRQTLIRQEDTIIFLLIERAQFARNAAVYEADAVPVPDFDSNGRRYSLLEYLLRETEQIHGRIRRYTSPDEQAFYPERTPSLVLPPIEYAEVLVPWSKTINLNNCIMDLYLQELMPGITEPGNDNNYGSAAMQDVLCLQALSKRIHYGKFVAEAKYRAHPEQYQELIQNRDQDAIMHMLTNEDVERKVVERVRRKAAIFGQDITDGTDQQPSTVKLEPSTVATLYQKWIMPLTKQVQVAYLLQRMD